MSGKVTNKWLTFTVKMGRQVLQTVCIHNMHSEATGFESRSVHELS
jgi:hypothetical protein